MPKPGPRTTPRYSDSQERQPQPPKADTLRSWHSWRSRALRSIRCSGAPRAMIRLVAPRVQRMRSQAAQFPCWFK